MKRPPWPGALETPLRGAGPVARPAATIARSAAQFEAFPMPHSRVRSVPRASCPKQSTLLLAVGDTGTNHEPRSVSSEGAPDTGKLTNAKAAMAVTP
ncbi:hypothetical protein EV567_4442 [Streptomyces sp. BK239]|nr:hypothetical protein EV567_4442 [Streptomyces sp. BK239]